MAKNEFNKNVAFVAETDGPTTQIAKTLCNEYFNKFFNASAAGTENAVNCSDVITKLFKEEDNIKPKLKTQLSKKLKDIDILVVIGPNVDLSKLNFSVKEPVIWEDLVAVPEDSYEVSKGIRLEIKRLLDKLKVDYLDGYISC